MLVIIEVEVDDDYEYSGTSDTLKERVISMVQQTINNGLVKKLSIERSK